VSSALVGGHHAQAIHGWFEKPERVALLIVRAQHWVGTPFCPNSNVAGPKGGVSCQKLASALYAESGFARIEVPEVAMSHARFAQFSLVEEWMDKRTDFHRVMDLHSGQSGDLLGFRIRRCIHHLGILLAGGVFIHALEHCGTGYNNLADPTWSTRLGGVWRPLEVTL
jgi:cell wall-associated NlpC family hydrolase